jgi:hypothetical protein
VVLHQLDDDSDVVAVVLDGDDSHDVGRVFGVRVLAVLVRQDQTRVGFVNLDRFHTSVTVVDTAFVRNLPVRHGSIRDCEIYHGGTKKFDNSGSKAKLCQSQL